MVKGYCDNTAFLSAIRHLVISFDEQRSLIERDRNINRTPIDDHPASRKKGREGGRCAVTSAHIGVTVPRVLAARTSDTFSGLITSLRAWRLI